MGRGPFFSQLQIPGSGRLCPALPGSGRGSTSPGAACRSGAGAVALLPMTGPREPKGSSRKGLGASVPTMCGLALGWWGTRQGGSPVPGVMVSPPAQAFLCFALAFCALVQVTFWRFHDPTQVEDAVLDTYDLVFDRAVKNLSGIWRQELAAIQDTFLCCGKSSPLGLQGSSGADLCQGEGPARQVYAVLLSAFLCFAIHSGRSLDRKGKYTLSPRASGRQPQEPSFFRCCQEGPAPRHPPEADVCEARPGPSRCLRASFLLQDTKPPTHGGGSDTAALART
ncbi:tetraspanin-32 isoform X4 [Sus scrofa]|uniref:tetraspanin-32 isoform X4 n=1 Tax=Sus scrofa TaxID=9823 RepID=UPI000A2B8CB4|nr:tetraspanin-32 isoform X4 [Sus scrofa]